jgi:2-polyprenyl-3-methyl-5-hydroxy-6-metoxy-1,4-benzoquinol methylase
MVKSHKDGIGYNERLFTGGLRSKLHFARFHWFSFEIARRQCATDAVLELGCFDGKLLDFFASSPSRYVGFDANWEGGLDIAKMRRGSAQNCSFFRASSPEDMYLNSNDVFHIAVAMETLEHVPPEMVDGYLRKIAEHLDGYLFVTVPNEKGLVFLAKWIVKRIFSKDAEDYSLAELTSATLGRMEQVARREHKGFDYQSLVKDIAKHFDVIAVSGHPLGFLPSALCFGIGIIAKSRRPVSSL